MHPFDVVKIGRSAFMKCCQLAEVVILPAAQASVGRLGLHTLVFGEGAFRECTSLRCMNIPSHPVKVLDNTFWGCTKLTEVSSYQTHCVNSRDIYSTIVNHWHTSTFLPLYKRLEADRSWGLEDMSICFFDGITRDCRTNHAGNIRYVRG